MQCLLFSLLLLLSCQKISISNLKQVQNEHEFIGKLRRKKRKRIPKQIKNIEFHVLCVYKNRYLVTPECTEKPKREREREREFYVLYAIRNEFRDQARIRIGSLNSPYAVIRHHTQSAREREMER